MRGIGKKHAVNSRDKRVRVLFVEVSHEGSIGAIHRSIPIARELERHGFECEIIYGPNLDKVKTKGTLQRIVKSQFKALSDIPTILKHGLKNRVIIFRRYLHPWAFLLAIFFRLLGKCVLLDIDDNLFTTAPNIKARWLFGIKSWVSTVLLVLSSSAIVVGSHFLKELASRYNKKVFLVPTAVDTQLFRPTNLLKNTNQPILGSFASGDAHFRFLEDMKEALVKLSQEGVPFTLRLLGAEKFKRTRSLFTNVPFPVEVTPWVEFEKIPESIAEFDINLYPLTDDDRSRGKCALRILEAMSMEVPSVASAVGESIYVINDGKDGLLAANQDEWVEKLRLLIANPNLREQMGQKGREKIVKQYSQEVVGRQWASVLNQCLKRSTT